MRPLWTPIRMGLCIRMPQRVKNWKRTISKKHLLKYQRSNWHTIDTHLVNLTSKGVVFSKIYPAFQLLMGPFWPSVWMRLCIRMPRVKSCIISKMYLMKYQISNWHTIVHDLVNCGSKGAIFSQIWPFLQLLIRLFWTSVWMGLCIHTVFSPIGVHCWCKKTAR